MRTTMTLEKDVAARLERLARARRQPMKTLVNEALRAGLSVIERPVDSIALIPASIAPEIALPVIRPPLRSSASADPALPTN